MNSRRLVVVARRFWPAANLSEICLSALLTRLTDYEFDIIVLTPRWNRNWNYEFRAHGIEVLRLPRPSVRRWRSEPFTKALKAWFTENESGIDQVLVWNNWQDSLFVEAATHASQSIVSRVDARSVEQMIAVTQHQPMRVQSTLTESASQFHRHIYVCDHVTLGVARSKQFENSAQMKIIDDTLPFDGTSLKSRTDSRLSLSDSHQMLAVELDQPLGIYVGEIGETFPVKQLVKAWSLVVKRNPAARFWFIGQGNGCEQLWQMLLHYQVQHSMLIVGDFDALEDLLIAADFAVGFEWDGLTSSGTRLASALGLPVVLLPMDGGQSNMQSAAKTAAEIDAAFAQSSNRDIHSGAVQAAQEFDRFVDRYVEVLNRARP
jgi:hypothetical protein